MKKENGWTPYDICGWIVISAVIIGFVFSIYYVMTAPHSFMYNEISIKQYKEVGEWRENVKTSMTAYPGVADKIDEYLLDSKLTKLEYNEINDMIAKCNFEIEKKEVLKKIFHEKD